MHYHQPGYECANCQVPTIGKVHTYSMRYFGFSLCWQCQDLLKPKFAITSRETIKLYFSLRKRGVPAELEKFDGYKTIDIAVVEARVNIEVDGKHHHYNMGQAMADLQRTFYSFKKGYLTLRIPNALVAYNLEETAGYITRILNVRLKNTRQ